MAIFSVIDTTSGGDSWYEGMVKAVANWAIMETELTDARGGEATLDTRLDLWSSHTHGTGDVVLTIVTSEAALGTGATDGELKICSATGNRYMWEAGSAKWQPLDGNKYATASLPTTAYNIVTGTIVFDTTTGYWKKWGGASFANCFLTWDGSSTDIVAATARTSIGIDLSVSAKTSAYPVTATDLIGNKTFTNTAAVAEVNFTLPAGAAGRLSFIVTAAQYLKITANGTEKFRYYDAQSAAGGYIRSNVVGTSFNIEWSGTEWIVSNLVGFLLYDE